MPTERIAWVDYAKGACIIMVVMMHCYNRVADATGANWLHYVVDFARPFRMPDFFLISGLFLGLSINGPILSYLDRKVLHFAYFYVLWLAIQITIFDLDGFVANPNPYVNRFVAALIEPTNTLWFVHMLAVFYVVTRLLRRVPPWLVFIAAAGLQVAYEAHLIRSDWGVANHFAERYVFFFSGYSFAPLVFALARGVAARPRWALFGLVLWALVNGALVLARVHEAPFIGLVLGFVGASAIVSFGALMANRDWAKPIRYAGANSIVVYLTFFAPLLIMQKFFFDWTHLGLDNGSLALVMTLVSVITPLIFLRVIGNTPLNFLYVRPAFRRLSTHFSGAGATRPAPT